MHKQQPLLLLVSPVNLSAGIPVRLVGEDVLTVQSSDFKLQSSSQIITPSPCLVKGQQSFIVL